MLLRPVRDDEQDAELVREIAAAAFGEPHSLYGPGGPAAARVARQHSRIRHLARTDPGGCWVMEDEGAGPVGAVLSSKREGTWALSLLAVVPGAQGKEVGKALLARALDYGRACLRGIACLPDDPVAARTLRRAGLTLHPTMRLSGVVDAGRLGPLDGPVHEGTERHRELMDSVDRRTRGGAHGPDHEELLRHHTLLVVDDLAGTGYCYARPGRVEALAATSRRLATRLLTAALLATPPGDTIRITHVPAEAQWALDVAVTAGLAITPSGFLALRLLHPPELALTPRTLP
ncbi:GNAT family N-acetyltransferase [Actinacidiphila guanduensis]|uniref:Acetyltransferase (GNAT) family protein n=1 Tax=Actinacidiphila guanduensis TaxID=310781 RepID=A0A1H0DH15_9ACTN|nr:GNAT family N-acetyltransferase [Actinacidiphila guanduensis]SDN69374.1 Acetyltransferase (GNAT) family protein [Actinacidiphila guanduensis]